MFIVFIEFIRTCLDSLLEPIKIIHLESLCELGFYIPSESNPKKAKPNPIEKKGTSSWQQETRSITGLPDTQQSPIPEYRRHWY